MKITVPCRCQLILISLVFLFSCDYDYKNIDSKRPDDVSVESVFNAAQIECARLIDGDTNNRIMLLAQQFANINYPRNDRYFFSKLHSEELWEQIYVNILANLNIAIQKSQNQGLKNVELTSRIMRVWTFSIATDLYGDIPYFDASTVASENKIILPKYDLQRDIYVDMIKELKHCNSYLSIDVFYDNVFSDLIYGGDILKWRRFANTLLLRLYMRISEVEPLLAQKGVEDIFANPENYPLFLSNADCSKFKFLENVEYRGAMFTLAGFDNYYCMSKNLIDILNTNEDPRMFEIAQPTVATGLFNGQVNGGDLIGAEQVSQIGKRYLEHPDYSVYFVTYSELCFIKAEALNRGWNLEGDVEGCYYSGVDASLKQFGIDSVYLSNEKIKFNSSIAEQQIAVQKYISYFPQGVQAYSHTRRTGYPKNLMEAPRSYFPGKGIPVRFPYPEIELNANSNNIQHVLEGIEDGLFGKKIWWHNY